MCRLQTVCNWRGQKKGHLFLAQNFTLETINAGAIEFYVAYDLSCSTSTLASVCGQSSTSPDSSLFDSTLSSGSVDLPAGDQTPAVNVVPSPHREELSSPG